MKKIKNFSALLILAAVFFVGCPDSNINVQPVDDNYEEFDTPNEESDTPNENDSESETVPEGFVKIPAGTFRMGNTYVRNDWDIYCGTDYPHGEKVTLTKSFYMCDHEVTREEYYNVRLISPSYKDETEDGEFTPNRPVNYVSWYDAIVYCNSLSIKEELTPCYTIKGSTNPSDWGSIPYNTRNDDWDAVTCDFSANGYRLPTEAEWEYAARAGNNNISTLVWSGTESDSELNDYAWNHNNSNLRTHEVKLKKPNAFGLYDMSGNVAEWVWDRISTIGGSKGEPSDYEYEDPKRFYKDECCLIRGGAYTSIITSGTTYSNTSYIEDSDFEDTPDNFDCTVFYRTNFERTLQPHTFYDFIGIRVVRTAK